MRKRKEKLISYVLGVAMLAGGMTPLSGQAAAWFGWEQGQDGNWYWYEDGVKQGTEGRGKEIYDPATDGWYWLDAIDGGKKAMSKDVYQESFAGEYADREDGTGKWCRYDEQGNMVKGWDTNGNRTSYFDMQYGAMLKGNWEIDGVSYHFDETSGIMDFCSIGMEGSYWQEIDGVNYWFENGVRQGYDKAHPSYRGKEIYDPHEDAWFWLDNVQQGAKAVSKDVYQESVAGPWAENEDGTGKWVRYDADGHMVKGWDENEDGKYYFDLTYGTMAKGTVDIDGVTYNFDPATGILLEDQDDSQFSAKKVYEAMIALKEDYPEGMRWTNDNYYAWKGGIYRGGYGCAGFAFMLSDAAFGELRARKHTDFDDIKVGDILRINNNSHSVIVLEMLEDGVVIAEGNYNSSIHWGRKLSYATIKENGDYVLTRYPEQ